MKKYLFSSLLFSFCSIFLFFTPEIAKANKIIDSKNWQAHACFFVERGLEIRYYVITKNTKDTKAPAEVVIDKVKYPLYKTKTEAIEAVKFSSIKNDYTIVYVVSDKKKDPEIVAIAD